jgi:hypothetical protein
MVAMDVVTRVFHYEVMSTNGSVAEYWRWSESPLLGIQENSERFSSPVLFAMLSFLQVRVFFSIFSEWRCVVFGAADGRVPG